MSIVKTSGLGNYTFHFFALGSKPFHALQESRAVLFRLLPICEHMARLVLQRVPLLYNPKTGGDDGLVEDVAG